MEIEDETLVFLNQMPRRMMDHLKATGGALDFADTKTLLAERDAEWDVSETPKSTSTESNKPSSHSPEQELTWT
jgi:hypothetical protein